MHAADATIGTQCGVASEHLTDIERIQRYRANN
jgi:hypothetical protein